MKVKPSSSKRRTYEAPSAEIFETEAPAVLCYSALMGNSTESVTTQSFIFP